MKKILILVIVAVLIVGGYFGYKKMVPEQKGPAMSAIPVDVIVATESDFYPNLSFVSKIEAVDKVAVRARVTGFLMKRLFKEGDFVEKGQLLFQIEKDQFEADVRKAEANLARAEANAQNAESQYKRAQNLFKTKDVSEARLDERLAEYNTAQASVKQAQSELDLAKLNLDYTDIRAPLSGRIGASVYSEGALIGPESGALATLVSTTPMYAVFSVSENQLLQMKSFLDLSPDSDQAEKAANDLDITFQFADGKTYGQKGSLNFIDIALDDQMNTLKLRVSFPNTDNELIAGQYGRVNIVFKRAQKALLIPSVLIQRDLAGGFLYVVSKAGTLTQKRVQEGLELTNGMTIITKGLDVGDKILINNFQKAPYMIGAPVAPQVKSVQDFMDEQKQKMNLNEQ